MRTENLGLVGDSLSGFVHFAAVHSPVNDCPSLRDFRTIFYILFIAGNEELKFDAPIRAHSLNTFAHLIEDPDSDLSDVAVGLGAVTLLGRIYEEGVPELSILLPCVLSYLARRSEFCLSAVVHGVPLAVFEGFLAEQTTREPGLRLVVSLCRYPIPIPEYRRHLLRLLISVFCDDDTANYWIAVIGVCFWTLRCDPETEDWRTELNASDFLQHFAVAMASPDPDVIISCLRMVQVVPSLAIPLDQLIAMIHYRDTDERSDLVLAEAAAALARVVGIPGKAGMAISRGLLEAIDDVFDNASFRAKDEVCECIARVAIDGTDADRRDLVERGAVARLVEGIGAGTDRTLLDIVTAFGWMARGTQTVKGNLFFEALGEDGWRALLGLLDHGNKAVAEKAAWFYYDSDSDGEEDGHEERAPVYEFCLHCV
jgi:hypothetical protein